MDGVILTNFAIIVACAVVLCKAGDFVVRYAVQVSNALRVTSFFVGFVILALASALPDLAVAITSALSGAIQVAAGDVVGANMTDVAFVLGATMVYAASIFLPKQERKKYIWVLGFTGSLMAIMFAIGSVSILSGWVLLGCYGLAMTWAWKTRLKDDFCAQCSNQGECRIHQAFKPLIKLFISLGVLFVTSTVIVNSAIAIAASSALPLETVGATILAIGTTMPEIVLSFNAVRQKQFGLAVGSTLGTVLEQGTLILGLIPVLSGKVVNLKPLWGAALFMFAAFFILVYALYRQRLVRPVGIALLGLFASYLAYHFVPIF